MLNFYQFWDKLNGKPYEDGVPPPVPYNFVDMNYGSGAELTPLEPEDMASSARMEPEEYKKFHKGKPTGLGKQMTDDELNKFYGQGW